MSGVVSWQPMVLGEKIVRYADFADELAAGESLTGPPVVTATVWSGNDPGPGIVNSAGILTNTAGIPAVVAVTLTNGVLGTIYQCVVSCTTSAGRTIIKTATLVIKPPLN